MRHVTSIAALVEIGVVDQRFFRFWQSVGFLAINLPNRKRKKRKTKHRHVSQCLNCQPVFAKVLSGLRGGAGGSSATKRKRQEREAEVDLLAGIQALLAKAVSKKPDPSPPGAPKSLVQKLQSLVSRAQTDPSMDLLPALKKLVDDEVAKRQPKSEKLSPAVPPPKVQQSAATIDRWRNVQRWKLKAGDWSSSKPLKILYSVDEFAQALDDVDQSLLVVLHSECEVSEVLQVLHGDRTVPVTVAWLTQTEGSAEVEHELMSNGLFTKWCRIPGNENGRISFRWARLVCSHKDAPWLRGWMDADPSALPVTRDKNSTVVLRVSARKHYTYNDWKQLCSRPGHYARQWCQSVCEAQGDDVMDAWNFQCHNSTMIQGLVRIKSADVARLLVQSSGSLSDSMQWFVDVAASDVLPDIPRQVSWCVWDRQEDWEAYISRARRDAPY